ncbi:MAG TPA: chemotaxis protein CheB, partial [Acidimicrobiales bacterium]|nr:chemotaxis protein CheB [Acidimicrobiales bacterium]
GPSVLPRILERAGELPARHAVDGEPLEAGVILVAPPDHHLLVEDGHVRVTRGPREGGHRPSADTLLRSLASGFGPRAAGVVLSGMMDDGAAGLLALRVAGGLALVQSPESSAFPGMPLAAIELADPQIVAEPRELARQLRSWIGGLSGREGAEMTGTSGSDGNDPGPAALAALRGGTADAAPADPPAVRGGSGGDPDPVGPDPENDPALTAPSSPGETRGGDSSSFPPAQQESVVSLTCPDCGGTLWLREEFGAERFSCRVGHSFSAASLFLGKQDALEAAVWAAIVALEERLELLERMRSRAGRQRLALTRARYEREAEATRAKAAVLRAMIESLSQVPIEDEAHHDEERADPGAGTGVRTGEAGGHPAA